MKRVLLLMPGFLLMCIFYLQISAQPYPASDLIKSLKWDDKIIKLVAGSGDNWPITWINDTLQITSYGDGNGFNENDRNLSLGLAYIIGDPPNHRGIDIHSNIDIPMGGGPAGLKTSGILMVNDKIYLYARNFQPEGSEDYTNARLAWSEDQGKTFSWADWYFEDTFGCPDFIQFGMNYNNSRDDYVYIVSQDNDNAYKYAHGIVLARVLQKDIPNRSEYTFFAGFTQYGKPLWTSDITKRKQIFQNKDGVERISITFNQGLKRYFLVTSFNPGNTRVTHTGALGIFEAPEPWGPWRTVYYNARWSGDCRTYHHRFPSKWISRNGKEMYLLFSGLDCGYYDFCVQKVTLNLF